MYTDVHTHTATYRKINTICYYSLKSHTYTFADLFCLPY